jgi:dolichyl-phosphate beta-glucosyltransferase
VIVVPCYNEERRLDEREFLPFLERGTIEVLFVDDGSMDGTGAVLQAIAKRHEPRVRVLTLPVNRGKAEAVRQGMRQALAGGAGIVGYLDADASTPARQLLRLLAALEERRVDVVMGARVHLLGSDIQRSRQRHYLGRVFATCASLILSLPVYDTQCGAKLFRDTPALRFALEKPFASRWAFDVELLGRLLAGGPHAPALRHDSFLEIPLESWRDVAGSKLGLHGMLKSGVELVTIGAKLRRERAASRRRR